jgi:hypothetical protein
MNLYQDLVEAAHQEKMMLEQTILQEEAARLDSFQRAPKLGDLKVANLLPPRQVLYQPFNASCTSTLERILFTQRIVLLCFLHDFFCQSFFATCGSGVWMFLQEESKRLISAIQMESASKGSLQLELNTLHEDLAKINSVSDVLRVGLPLAVP